MCASSPMETTPSEQHSSHSHDDIASATSTLFASLPPTAPLAYSKVASRRAPTSHLIRSPLQRQLSKPTTNLPTTKAISAVAPVAITMSSTTPAIAEKNSTGGLEHSSGAWKAVGSPSRKQSLSPPDENEESAESLSTVVCGNVQHDQGLTPPLSTPSPPSFHSHAQNRVAGRAQDGASLGSSPEKYSGVQQRMSLTINTSQRFANSNSNIDALLHSSPYHQQHLLHEEEQQQHQHQQPDGRLDLSFSLAVANTSLNQEEQQHPKQHVMIVSPSSASSSFAWGERSIRSAALNGHSTSPSPPPLAEMSTTEGALTTGTPIGSTAKQQPQLQQQQQQFLAHHSIQQPQRFQHQQSHHQTLTSGSLSSLSSFNESTALSLGVSPSTHPTSCPPASLLTNRRYSTIGAVQSSPLNSMTDSFFQNPSRAQRSFSFSAGQPHDLASYGLLSTPPVLPQTLDDQDSAFDFRSFRQSLPTTLEEDDDFSSSSSPAHASASSVSSSFDLRISRARSFSTSAAFGSALSSAIHSGAIGADPFEYDEAELASASAAVSIGKSVVTASAAVANTPATTSTSRLYLVTPLSASEQSPATLHSSQFSNSTAASMSMRDHYRTTGGVSQDQENDVFPEGFAWATLPTNLGIGAGTTAGQVESAPNTPLDPSAASPSLPFASLGPPIQQQQQQQQQRQQQQQQQQQLESSFPLNAHRRSVTTTADFITSPIWDTRGPGSMLMQSTSERDRMDRHRIARRFSLAPSSGFHAYEHYQDVGAELGAGPALGSFSLRQNADSEYAHHLQRRHSVAGLAANYVRPFGSLNPSSREPFDSITSEHESPLSSHWSATPMAEDDHFEHELTNPSSSGPLLGPYQHPRPSTTPATQNSNLELGKGLALRDLPHHGSLYVVEFKAGRSDVYYIADDAGFTVKKGDLVIVEADRGKDLGKVMDDSLTPQQIQAIQAQQAETAAALHPDSHWAPRELHPKRIFRLALPNEIQLLLTKNQDEINAMILCQSKVRQKSLPMDVVDAEYQWDRRKLTFYFFSDRRIDFRDLVRDLFRIYKTRIWMYAVNPVPVYMYPSTPTSPSSAGSTSSQVFGQPLAAALAQQEIGSNSSVSTQSGPPVFVPSIPHHQHQQSAGQQQPVFHQAPYPMVAYGYWLDYNAPMQPGGGPARSMVPMLQHSCSGGNLGANSSVTTSSQPVSSRHRTKSGSSPAMRQASPPTISSFDGTLNRQVSSVSNNGGQQQPLPTQQQRPPRHLRQHSQHQYQLPLQHIPGHQQPASQQLRQQPQQPRHQQLPSSSHEQYGQSNVLGE